MPEHDHSKFRRCFISAPFGMDLGALPQAIAERNLSWEWAKESPNATINTPEVIAESDFLIGVLNGSRSDYRVIFDAGVAIGLGKPVLLIQTRARALPIDWRQFTVSRVRLDDWKALAFHLDLFLSAPPQRGSLGEAAQTVPPIQSSTGIGQSNTAEFESALERKVYDAIEAGGGRAVTQHQGARGSSFRPDLLAWLGSHDAELLDPAVVEIRERVSIDTMGQVEEQLLSFMQKTGIRTGIALSVDDLPKRAYQRFPNIFWIKFDLFESLLKDRRLGAYIRQTRNRSMHGAR